MLERRRLWLIVYLLLAVLAIGIIGYMLIEKWAFIDALYMTVITISTVGYSEVLPLSQSGKIFSTFLIIGGVGVALYGFTTIIDYFVKGRISNLFGRHRMQEEIAKLRDHYIVCGFGRIGQVIARSFTASGVKFIIIDSDETAMSQATNDGYLCINGDATDYETLRQAGINEAQGLLAVTDNDATNVFIIVTARRLSKDLFIAARASSQDSIAKLEEVGANRAIDPYYSGGERLARIALHPSLTDFIDKVLPGKGGDLSLEEVEVDSQSILSGKSIRDAQEYCRGASILALRKAGGKTLPKPSDSTTIDAGDRLIVLGLSEQLCMLGDTGVKIKA